MGKASRIEAAGDQGMGRLATMTMKMHTNVAHVRSATIIHRPPSTVYIQMAAIYTGHVHAAHRGVRKIEQEN